jgi:hypothetical protein
MSDNMPMMDRELFSQYLAIRENLSTLKYELKNLNIPKLVLVGIQSAGKTTFLEVLTGLPLGFVSQKTGNRCLVEYTLSHVPDLDGYEVEVKSPSSLYYKKISEKELVKEVSKHMKELENEKSFSNEIFSVLIRSKYVFDLILLDSIGFIPNSANDDSDDSDRIKEINATVLRDLSYQPIVILKATENVETVPDKDVIGPAFVDKHLLCDLPIRPNWKKESIFIMNYMNDQLPKLTTIEEANEFFTLDSHSLIYFVALKPDIHYKRNKTTHYDEIKRKLLTVREEETEMFNKWKENLMKTSSSGSTISVSSSLKNVLLNRLGITNTISIIISTWGKQIANFFDSTLNEIRLRQPKVLDSIITLRKRLDLSNGSIIRDRCSEMINEFYRRIQAFQKRDSYALGVHKVCYSNEEYGSSFKDDLENIPSASSYHCLFIKEYDIIMKEITSNGILPEVSFGKDCQFRLLGTRAYRRVLSILNLMLISQDFQTKSDDHLRQLGETRSGEYNPMEACTQLAREQITEAGSAIEWFTDMLRSLAMRYCNIVINSLISDSGPFPELKGIIILQEALRKNYQDFINSLLMKLRNRWEEDIEMYSTVIKFDAPVRMLLSLLVTPFEESLKDAAMYYPVNAPAVEGGRREGTMIDGGDDDEDEDVVGEADESTSKADAATMDETSSSASAAITGGKRAKKTILSHMKKFFTRPVYKRGSSRKGSSSNRKSLGKDGKKSSSKSSIDDDAESYTSCVSSPKGMDHESVEQWETLHDGLKHLRKIMKGYGRRISTAECVAGGHQSLGIADAGLLDYNYLRKCAYEYYIVTMHTIVLNLETRFESCFITNISEDKKNELLKSLNKIMISEDSKEDYSDMNLALMTGIDAIKIKQEIIDLENEKQSFENIIRTLNGHIQSFREKNNSGSTIAF